MEFMREHEKLVIYGTGEGAKLIFEKAFVYSDKIAVFLDRNNNQKNLFGKPVCEIGATIEADAIIIASDAWLDIYPKLKVLYPHLNYYCPYGKIELFGRIGKHTYGANDNTIEHSSLIEEIGSFCSINEHAKIGLGNHAYDIVTTFPLRKLIPHDSNHNAKVSGKIKIGNDVWIGANSIILPNVL